MMSDYKNQVLFGDAYEQLKTVPDETAQMCVTSPPYYGLRDYGHDGQLGLEETPEEYVEKLVSVFSEVKRVLKDDGTLWLNIGDSYAGGGRGGDPKHLKGDNSAESTMESYKGIPAKNLIGIPWMVAFAIRSDGWYLRQDIIWHKPNPMPESVKDRCTKSHEYVFLLSKSAKYYYDYEAIKEDATSNENRPDGIVRNREYNYDSKLNEVRGHKNLKENGQENHSMHKLRAKGKTDKVYKKKNKRSVWTIGTKPYPEAHFAVYPPELIAPCIKAGSKPYDIVLDPFFGSGTTGEVCKKLNRHYLGIELNEDYKLIQDKRLSQSTFQFME